MDFNNIQINFAPGRHTRYESMDGREYLVAPMVMLTVGVHNGSNGPILYEETELSKTPEAWNMKPLVVYHPTNNGEGISACSPEVIETSGVGMIMNTRWDGKLRAEAWFDVEKLKKVDERILNALEQGNMMEVSTGLFTDNELVKGTFEDTGEDYVAIAHNFRPDHLAILPDKIGACSIADGAGLLQTNALSHSDQHSRLHRLIRDEFGSDAWIVDVFDKWFVYANGSKLFRAYYTKKKDVITLDDTPSEAVVAQTVYRSVDGTLIGNATAVPTFKPPKKETKMPKATKKETLVKDLIGNEKTPFVEDDREFLESKDETYLQGLVPVANDDKEEDRKDKDTPPEENLPGKEVDGGAGKVDKPDTPTGNQQGKPMTMDQFIANAPPEMRDSLRAQYATHEAERRKMIETVTANEHNEFTEDELKALPHDQLRKQANMVAKLSANDQEEAPQTFPNYAGAAGSPTANASLEEDPLEMPAWN